MRKIIFTLTFALIGTFAFASTEVGPNIEKSILENRNEPLIDTTESIEFSVTYCVSYDGNLYCCEGETYSEARSCARSMAMESLQPAPK